MPSRLLLKKYFKNVITNHFELPSLFNGQNLKVHCMQNMKFEYSKNQ